LLVMRWENVVCHLEIHIIMVSKYTILFVPAIVRGKERIKIDRRNMRKKILIFFVFLTAFGIILVITFWSSMSRSEKGSEAYYNALSSSFTPITEQTLIDKKGKIVHRVHADRGKYILTVSVTDDEIAEANSYLNDIVKRADAFQTAYQLSEFEAKKQAEKCVFSNKQMLSPTIPKPPCIPAYLSDQKERWERGWRFGWKYNFNRYIQWMKLYDNKKLDGQKDDQENHQMLKSLLAPSYDSDWLLYNPGEYKILRHNLNVSPDRIFVNMIIKIKGGKIAEAFADKSNDKGVIWSNLTYNKIYVQRLYNDTLIEAIRIRLWVY
jgi:hypothetical protein